MQFNDNEATEIFNKNEGLLDSAGCNPFKKELFEEIYNHPYPLI